jgi:hypothetical protein
MALDSFAVARVGQIDHGKSGAQYCVPLIKRVGRNIPDQSILPAGCKS